AGAARSGCARITDRGNQGRRQRGSVPRGRGRLSGSSAAAAGIRARHGKAGGHAGSRTQSHGPRGAAGHSGSLLPGEGAEPMGGIVLPADGAAVGGFGSEGIGMVIYEKGYLKVAEIFFDEREAETRADIVRYQFRPEPIRGCRSADFHTLVCNLGEDPDVLMG